MPNQSSTIFLYLFYATSATLCPPPDHTTSTHSTASTTTTTTLLNGNNASLVAQLKAAQLQHQKQQQHHQYLDQTSNLRDYVNMRPPPPYPGTTKPAAQNGHSGGSNGESVNLAAAEAIKSSEICVTGFRLVNRELVMRDSSSTRQPHVISMLKWRRTRRSAYNLPKKREEA